MQWVPWATSGGRYPSPCRVNTDKKEKRARRARHKRFALGLACASTLIAGASRAANVSWIAPTDGLWREEYRWSSAPNLPAPDDNVTIDIPILNILVTVNQDLQTVNSVLCNERLTIESGGLSLAADSTFNGAFTLSGGTLAGGGNVTLNGASTWINQSTMEGSGKTIVSTTGSLTITPGTFTKYLKRNLENSGAITFNANSPFSSISLTGATITNKVGGVFNTDSSVDTFFYGDTGTNAFINQGIFNKTGTATATFGGFGSNPVPFVNSGQVNLNGGTMVLQTGATHTGHFAIAAGTTLQLEGSHTFSASSDLIGAGQVFFNSTGANTSDGIVNISGTTLFAGGNNTFNGPFTAGNFLAPNGASFTFNAPTTLGSATVTNLSLAGSGDVSISGTSQWNGYGTMSGAGKTIVTAGSTFTFTPGGAAKNLQRTFINKGTVNWNGAGALATLNLSDAVFDNRAGAIFNAGGDQYAFNGVAGANSFLNAGTFNKSGTGSASFGGAGTSAVGFINSGTLNVLDGMLKFDGPFSNSANVALLGGTLTLAAGLTNTGTISVTGGTLNLGGAFTTAQLGNWSNAGGQVNLLGNLNNLSATLALSNTTGPLRMLAGSKIIGGAVTTGGTSRLEIVGAATLDGLTIPGSATIFQQTNLTLVNGLTLAGGTLTLDAAGASVATFQGSHTIGGTGQVTTAGGTGTTAALCISAGDTLTIGPGVTIHPGTRDILLGSSNGAVVNQGTLLVDASGRMLKLAGDSVQNSGTLQAQGGGTLYISGNLANLAGGTLTGGTWRVFADSQLRLGGGISNNAAILVLDGAGSNLYIGASGSNDALANLSQNAAGGDLSILNGRALATGGDFVNDGKLTIGAGAGLSIPGLFTQNGTMTAAGAVSSNKTIVDGFFTLAGGTHTVATDLVVGAAKSSARYDLNGGTLSVAGFTTVGLGPGGAGIFNQGGGNFTVGKQLYVSTAGSNTSTFNLSGGTLAAGELFVAFFGGAQGTFNQTGGAVTLTGNSAVSTTGGLSIGFSSLPSTSGTYNLASGTLSDQGAQIGYAGSGIFNQSAGTHTVNGSLSLGMFTGGTGSYSLSNSASLSISGDETVGAYGNGLFNQTGGTHSVAGAIVLGANFGSTGTFNLSGSGSLTVADTSYVGFSGIGTFTQNGGTHITGSLFIAAAPGSSGSYALTAGSLHASSTTNNGTYTQSGGAAALGSISGKGTMSVSGGTLSAGWIRQNSLALSNDALVKFAVDSGVSILKTLTFSNAPGATAAIDLANDTLLVDYTASTVIGEIRARVASGYNASGAHWTGPGIRSSTAAGDARLGIAVAEASDVLHITGAQTAALQGQTVDATTVMLRVTLLGDTNLDGRVGFGDFQRFEQGFGQGGTWFTGDFNSDGVVDRADFAMLQSNFGQALGSAPLPVSSEELQLMNAFAAGVPEPASLAAFALAGAAAMLRRSRRR